MQRRLLIAGAAALVVAGAALVFLRTQSPSSAPPKTPRRGDIGPPGRGWRGDGTARFTDVTPPIHWSETAGVLWRSHLPTSGNATPILVGNKLFVTAEPNRLIALSASDGKMLWQQESNVLDALSAEERAEAVKLVKSASGLEMKTQEAEAEITRLKKELRKSAPEAGIPERITALQSELVAMRDQLDRAAPFMPPPDWPIVGTASITPVTDGHNLYVAFGTFVVASYDLDGNRRWIRYFPHPAERKERGRYLEAVASPLLVADRLILPLVDLYGLDPETGRTIWTGPRIFDFGTPAWVRLGDTDVIITASGFAVRATDGKVLAQDLTTLACKSVGPIVSGRTVIFTGTANKMSHGQAVAEAVRLPESATEPFAATPLWRRDLGPDMFYAAPMILGDRMIGVDSMGKLKVVDVATGNLLEDIALPRFLTEPYSSTTVAGDYLYVSSSGGDTAVLEAKPPYKEVARNQLGDDGLFASPVFTANRLFLRTASALYAINGADTAPLAERAPPQPGTRSEPAHPAAGLPEAPAVRSAAAPTIVEPRSGLEFVDLPGGSFLFGCEPGDPDCQEIEKPARGATVAPFRIGKTEVTVAAYEACVKDGACTAAGTGDGCNGSAQGNHPINCVDVKQSAAFCSWIGGRLPSPAEWEYAAKGGGGRRYPWGNSYPTGAHANMCDARCKRSRGLPVSAKDPDDGFSYTAPVGHFPRGASPDGILDLSGNVWEWTVNDDATRRVGVRGSGWDVADPRELRASYHPWAVAPNGDANIGVRCVLPK